MRIDRRTALGMLGSIPLVRAAGASAQPLGSPSRRALVIGIDAYRSARPLTRAVADARAVAEKLSTFGYSVSLVVNPDLAELRNAVDAHAASLLPGSPSFLFFAGHAVQLQGTNLLMATDTQVASAQALGSTAWPMPLALETIARSEPSQSIVILDACRDAPFRSSIPELSSGIASINAPGGFYVVYSAGSGETALDRLGDDDGAQNGVFTRALLPRLRVDSSIQDIIQRTKGEVIRMAASIGHSQHPATYDQTSGPITLLGTTTPPAADVPRIARPTDPNSRFLAIGLANYDRSLEPSLTGAAADARLVGTSLRSSGIEGEVLVDPDEAAIRDAILDVAQARASTVILYLAGRGVYDRGDAVLLLDIPAVSSARWIERSLRLSEILQLLQPPSRYENNVVFQPLRGRRMIVLLDAQLASDDQNEARAATDELLESEKLLDLLRLQPDRAERYYGPTAVMCAADLQSRVLDLVPGQHHGAFALALQNAFSRPGATLQAMSEQVAREVAEITRPPTVETGQGSSESIRRKRLPTKRLVLAGERTELQRTAFWPTPSMPDFRLTQSLG